MSTPSKESLAFFRTSSYFSRPNQRAGPTKPAGSSSQPISSRYSRLIIGLLSRDGCSTREPVHQGVALLLAGLEIPGRAKPGQVADPGDIGGALRHGDGPARVEHVERVGTLEEVIVGRENEVFLPQPEAFLLVHLEQGKEQRDVGHLEIVLR